MKLLARRRCAPVVGAASSRLDVGVQWLDVTKEGEGRAW
jgi:hypothetical protein